LFNLADTASVVMLNIHDATGSHTRIKFCGMTCAVDVQLAGDLRVDAIGLVFAARSPRRVDLDHALTLRDAAAPVLGVIALVMDNPATEVETIVRHLQPQLLQFHGNEDDAFCAHFGIPFLKALPMRDIAAADVPALLARYPSAAGFVFDGHAPGAMGGSGERFDWSRMARQQLKRPWLLAGGLNAGNVGLAIRAVQPWGVDVSSGIEFQNDAAVPGIKDATQMRAFVDAVRGMDVLDRNRQDLHEQR
jgi:phosphoribosylanthranilate isomerase